MVRYPTWRKAQIWANIRQNHHSVVNATDEKFENHYLNLLRPTSWILREFDPSTPYPNPFIMLRQH